MNEAGVVMIGASEVPMIEADVVEHVRALRRAGWGVKRTARELGLSRNTVRKYRDETVPIGLQTRPAARSLTEAQSERAAALYKTTAAWNAVVVRDRLEEESVAVALRTVQRGLAPLR